MGADPPPPPAEKKHFFLTLPLAPMKSLKPNIHKKSTIFTSWIIHINKHLISEIGLFFICIIEQSLAMVCFCFICYQFQQIKFSVCLSWIWIILLLWGDYWRVNFTTINNSSYEQVLELDLHSKYQFQFSRARFNHN